MTPGNKRFYLYSLGCPKNLVDSEWLSSHLMAAGWRPTGTPSEAEVVVVNTCAFVEPAVAESLDAILSLHTTAPHAQLVVTGCLPLRYGRVLRTLLPEVSTFFLSRRMEGLDPKTVDAMLSGSRWVVHARDEHTGAMEIKRVVSTPFYTAYVKISDGCNRRCAFCTLPKIRGRYRSRPAEEIVQEVEELVSRGVKEIILVAQDTAAYGTDVESGTDLARLLDRLAGIHGVAWIKLLYLYPDVRRIGRRLVEVMKEHPKICPVIDVPIQHAAPKVLKRMRRPGPEVTRRVLDRLRAIPDVRLRTTIMVGFPGETEADFRRLCAFIEENRFYSLGVFSYSDEEGTRARELPDKVPEKEKRRRAEEVMELQQKIALQHNLALVGTVLPVLVEGPHEETDLLLRGRTAFQFPEIDGCVLINKGVAEIGDIVSVRVTEATPYDLVGEIVTG